MSSIIVLDSSDEDESPPKKINLKSTRDITNIPATKINSSKQRIIPSGITITPRQSPLAHSAKAITNVTTPSPISGVNLNHGLAHIVNHERQTPTPPRVPSQTQRKRKTPTPPMPRLAPKPFSNVASNIISPAAAATTMAPLPPIMPLISAVHSMSAAGATPPLQLMATPPHNLAAFAGLNDQMMINPHLIHSNLPPNTTITAHPNQNNINNNFKIHLPPKPMSTPSPAASPASSTPKTPSPQLAISPGPGRGEKTSKRIKPTTVLRSSDEAWMQQRHKLQSHLDKQNEDMVSEMLPPTMESPKSLSRQTSPSTSKSLKSPDVILVSSCMSATKSSEVLDLTETSDKLYTPTIINLVDTESNAHHRIKQLNGGGGTGDASKKDNQKCVDVNGKTTESEIGKDKPAPKPALEPEFVELIKVCRAADKSDDMEKLIKSKLIKYYYDVHADFVKSKSFRKSIRKVVEAIRAQPDLVYYNLKTIVEELKVRRKAKVVDTPAITPLPIKSEETDVNTPNADPSTTTTPAINDEHPSTSIVSASSSTSTGNKKLDEQIKKLNKALYVLTKRIEVLEQAEVDWDDDDSSFLQVERFKKRACQIYEKICDLTGESKNAHRLVKKPIKFNETRIPQFNKTLQAFINRTKEFPDYYDVLRMLEHCNRTYDLGLVNFEIKNIAEDAFIKVGKLLQSRRKADLYETVTHYGGNAKDPAKCDPTLAAKLNENQKNHRKISEILEKFARKQDMPEEEEDENKADNTEKIEENKSPAQTGPDDGAVKTTLPHTGEDEELKNKLNEGNIEISKTDVDDTDDDEEEDDEDEVNLEEHVETLANGDVSDNESDIENNEHSDSKENKDKNHLISEVTIEEPMSIDDAVDVPEVVQNIQNICDNIQTQTTNVDCTGNGENHSLTVNNNNLEMPTMKTVPHANAKDCKTPPPPNGKLKESTKLNICTTAIPTTIVNAVTTTTTTADLKIVTVSSLNNENIAGKNSECPILTSQSINKTLEEIVISDEDS